MSLSQISRFGISKTCQLKKFSLLLNVYSHKPQRFLSWDVAFLPHTVGRSWLSLTACSPGEVHDADKTWAAHGADKIWTVHGADKTSVHNADRICQIHVAGRTWTVHDTDKTSAICTTHRTLGVHASVNRNSLQIRNFSLSLNVMPLCFPSWRNFSTSSGQTDKQSQLPNKDSAVSTDKAGVNIGETNPEADLKTDGSVKEDDDAGKKLTLYQRFKKTYKEHGKILIAVHLLTSAVWFGSFYTVARCGVDVVSFMEKLNFSEKIISPFRSGGLGDIAVAYLMYKLATPARYTVTIGGTNLAIRYLRKEGKMPQVPQEDRIRSLYKEGKEHIKKRSRIHMRRLRKKHGIKSRIGHSKDKH